MSTTRGAREEQWWAGARVHELQLLHGREAARQLARELVAAERQRRESFGKAQARPDRTRESVPREVDLAQLREADELIEWQRAIEAIVGKVGDTQRVLALFAVWQRHRSLELVAVEVQQLEALVRQFGQQALETVHVDVQRSQMLQVLDRRRNGARELVVVESQLAQHHV